MVLERVEQNENDAKALEEQLREAEAVFQREKTKLESQTLSLTDELSKLEGHYKEIAQRVDAKLLARYSKLKTARKRICRGSGVQRHLFGMSFANPPPISG